MMNRFELKSMRELKRAELVDVIRNTEFLTSRERAHYPFAPIKRSIIAEIKKSSPGGTINPTVSVADQATAYEKGGAAAISVLTDSNFFSGSYRDLAATASRVTIPVLCKEFIYFTEQIDLAYLCGADMVLLIAQSLTFRELETLHNYALDKNMQPVIEINKAEEINRVMMLDPGIVMVNNRDLNTLAIDIDGGIEVLKSVPDTCVRIAASGISKRDEITRITSQCGVFTFLVGSSIMKSGAPSRMIQELSGVD